MQNYPSFSDIEGQNLVFLLSYYP